MAWIALAALPGWVLGVALQLQRAVLWPMWVYALGLLGCALLGGLALGVGRRGNGRWAIALALCASHINLLCPINRLYRDSI